MSATAKEATRNALDAVEAALHAGNGFEALQRLDRARASLDSLVVLTEEEAETVREQIRNGHGVGMPIEEFMKRCSIALALLSGSGRDSGEENE